MIIYETKNIFLCYNTKNKYKFYYYKGVISMKFLKTLFFLFIVFLLIFTAISIYNPDGFHKITKAILTKVFSSNIFLKNPSI